MSERLTSIVAGVVSAIALAALNYVAWGSPAAAAGGSFVCLLGVALWRRIRPAIFAAAVICTLAVAAVSLVAVTALSSNLIGLVVIGVVMLLVGTVAVVGLAALAASILRRWRTPVWISPVLCGLGLIVLVAQGGLNAQRSMDDLRRVHDRVEEIRRAEMAYADGNSAHSFTCNGPDLPGLSGLEWGTDPQMGGREQNRAHFDGYWIYLRCAASARPQSMSVSAVGANGNFQIAIKR